MARNKIESPKAAERKAAAAASKPRGREIRFWPYV
jgi:hypothetical protein